LRLKRVEMIGFKSFMDKTVIDFRDGITTVLGPNGCGKSNVVDAVRWVLGEQSAKQLRGDKMEDVIFKGTRRRKPMSMAEVSLVFDNADQRLPVPYDEVVVSRRVSRAGTSDYFLNKTQCRLKDIKDLFYDTGVGNNAYSVIEQEVVGQVLDPNENKVRIMLEEGSGIVRYKIKRKETHRKLDLTERDLLRVEDIVEEIGKQVRSLARQVGKARRHQRLFSEVRALELIRAHERISEMGAKVAEFRERDEQLRSDGTGDDAEAARLNAQVESMRPELEEMEQQRRQRAEALSEAEALINALESELAVLREKVEAGGRRQGEISSEVQRSRERRGEIQSDLDQARHELEELRHVLRERDAVVAEREKVAREFNERFEAARSQLGHAQQLSLGFLREEADQKQVITAAETRLEGLRAEEARLGDSIDEGERHKGELREILTDLETRLDAARREHSDVGRALASAQEDAVARERYLQEARESREESAGKLARLESRHEMAARIASELEGFRAGAAALLRDPQRQGRLQGAMAERMKVREGYEAAFELVFGEDADALLVGDVRSARELADHLAGEGLGMASFLAPVGGGGAAVSPAGVPGQSALDLVRLDEGEERRLRRWLERVRVVETNDEAVQSLMDHAGEGWSFLSREGLFLRHDGLVRGGAGARRELALFGRQEQVGQLAEEVERQRGILDQRQVAQEAGRDALERTRVRVEELRGRLVEAQESVTSVEREVAGHHSILEREIAAVERAVTERGRIRAEVGQLLEKVDQLHADLGRHGADQEASRKRVDELSDEVDSLEEARERANRELGESRLQLTHDRGVERELESRIERLSHMVEDLDAREERLSVETETLTGDIGSWNQLVESKGAEAAAHYVDRDARREELRGAQDVIEEKRAEVENIQDQLREVEKRRRGRAEALLEVETELTRMDLTVQNLNDRIEDKFQTTVEEGYAKLDPESIPRELVREEDTVQLGQVEELLAERQDKLDRIGPVNFVALDEYDEKKARLEFLEQQRDDLLKSREDLLQAIEKINRTARQLFRDTFEQVRQNFQEIFSTLFEGGQADLVIHKTDDPLESDIEVMARPSGKRVDSVALLSGGERALTAIALLFAVYLIKPSPFCILDEVDAPLDDMNVGRFVRLLERFAERTQFVVITHNKLTMEAADHLYGVTMEESGVSRLVSVSFDELNVEDPIAALEEVAAEKREEKAHPENRLRRADHRVLVAEGGGDGASLPVESAEEA
jgi:chromosome segregation protein